MVIPVFTAVQEIENCNKYKATEPAYGILSNNFQILQISNFRQKSKELSVFEEKCEQYS